jgi:hypothetical protein
MVGSLTVVADEKWIAFLDAEDVEAWYHNPRIYAWLRSRKLGFLVALADKLAPRGFARTDNVDGISPGDRVFLMQSCYDATIKAIAEWRMHGKIPSALWSAMNVVPHEFKHCEIDWTPTKEQLELFSHPTKAVPAVQHALRRKGAINAFTGLLRYADGTKDPSWPAFVAWFEGQQGLRETI